MTDEEKWAELVGIFKERQDALIRFPLFEGGWMKTDRLDEYNRLDDEVEAAKAKMDEFIKARFPQAAR